MTQDSINKLRVEVATDVLKSFISRVVTTQERVMFLKSKYKQALDKKESTRTEDDVKLLEEYEASIVSFTEDLQEFEDHIENFRILIQGYSEGRPVEV